MASCHFFAYLLQILHIAPYIVCHFLYISVRFGRDLVVLAEICGFFWNYAFFCLLL